MDVTRAFGLTVSLQKTKIMVVGHGVMEEEMLPLTLDDSCIVSTLT